MSEEQRYSEYAAEQQGDQPDDQVCKCCAGYGYHQHSNGAYVVREWRCLECMGDGDVEPGHVYGGDGYDCGRCMLTEDEP